VLAGDRIGAVTGKILLSTGQVEPNCLDTGPQLGLTIVCLRVESGGGCGEALSFEIWEA